ncbi:palmitoyltransferase ZDHHC15-like isoform X2 [Centruroides sculpturatus]|uniref:palmitoyltransferase ZDHHC15-like isoform X2 n=1 Tax=Centruroides sculpturatus TaxID=218467 RepID=UPI000C6D8E11|nr:palmitoyltransferase ZDHHC15-like isoform X2 [Centruroides sculpturatus]
MPPGLLKPGAKCSFCVRLFKWFPVIFITTIVAWSYYAYVIQLCFCTVNTVIETVCYFFVYHILFIMFMWSYWQTIFTDVGVVPKMFKLPSSEVEKFEKETSEENQRKILEKFAKELPVSCRALNGAIRYCEKCHHVKPDRAHHCSICGMCILKMDHHCPWVNNCVSFTNYKFFILFLGYALIYCVFIAATTLQYFIKFWTNDLEGWGKFHILFLFFVSVMFAISLVSLFGYHCYLVSVNRSTLESFRPPIFRYGPDKNGFSLGKYANFIEVFGEDKQKWFLPFATSVGDGIVYPTRAQPGSTYNSMGSTDPPSRGEGIIYPQCKREEDTNGLLNSQNHWSEGASASEEDTALNENLSNVSKHQGHVI